jgi:beta-glucosidase
MIPFMFATGIEGSYPTIDNGRVRRDQLEECGHYRLWRRDFELVRELGIRYLRYGPPLHTTWRGPGRYDWGFADETLGELQRLGIEPIVDLCHFGVPDWVGNFQNPDFPDLFRQYADDFAARYPWVRFYTPVNEIYICARHSGLFGWWNEQGTTTRTFITTLKHLVKANVLAMQAILRRRPDALFVQSESTEYFHPHEPDALDVAEAANLVRFLSLDLNYGRPLEPFQRVLVLDNGMTEAECQFFEQNAVDGRHCIIGSDYYVTNEHYLGADGSRHPAGELLGYSMIAREYVARYGLRLMHTETNRDEGEQGDEACAWLRRQWSNVLGLVRIGVPVVGFTWYSLTDQVDWDIALREHRGQVNPRGLFDLDRRQRSAGREYRELIAAWHARMDAFDEAAPPGGQVPRLPVDYEDAERYYAELFARVNDTARNRHPR